MQYFADDIVLFNNDFNKCVDTLSFLFYKIQLGVCQNINIVTYCNIESCD